MDLKEVHSSKYEKSTKFNQQIKIKARIQAISQSIENKIESNALRTKIQLLLNNHRGKKERQYHCSHFQGNGPVFNYCNHEKAINKLYQRIERKQISEDL